MSNDLSILRHVEPFSRFDEQAFSDFRGASEAHEVLAGRTLGAAGATVDSAYFLVDGVVIEEWPDGVVHHNTPGSLLISGALLSDKPCAHTWQVVEDSRLRRMSRASFEGLFAEGSAAAHLMLLNITELFTFQLRDLNRAFNALFKLRSATSDYPITR